MFVTITIILTVLPIHQDTHAYILELVSMICYDEMIQSQTFGQRKKKEALSWVKCCSQMLPHDDDFFFSGGETPIYPCICKYTGSIESKWINNNIHWKDLLLIYLWTVQTYLYHKINSNGFNQYQCDRLKKEDCVWYVIIL